MIHLNDWYLVVNTNWEQDYMLHLVFSDEKYVIGLDCASNFDDSHIETMVDIRDAIFSSGVAQSTSDDRRWFVDEVINRPNGYYLEHYDNRFIIGNIESHDVMMMVNEEKLYASGFNWKNLLCSYLRGVKEINPDYFREYLK